MPVGAGDGQKAAFTEGDLGAPGNGPPSSFVLTTHHLPIPPVSSSPPAQPSFCPEGPHVHVPAAAIGGHLLCTRNLLFPRQARELLPPGPGWLHADHCPHLATLLRTTHSPRKECPTEVCHPAQTPPSHALGSSQWGRPHSGYGAHASFQGCVTPESRSFLSRKSTDL